MGNKDSCETYKACGQSISSPLLLARLKIHMGARHVHSNDIPEQQGFSHYAQHTVQCWLKHVFIMSELTMAVENRNSIQGNVGNCTIYGKSNCLKGMCKKVLEK